MEKEKFLRKKEPSHIIAQKYIKIITEFWGEIYRKESYEKMIFLLVFRTLLKFCKVFSPPVLFNKIFAYL